MDGSTDKAVDSPTPPSPPVKLSERTKISKREHVPGLPRPSTFRRQDSERREKLKPVEPSMMERRAALADWGDGQRTVYARPASSPLIDVQKRSAPGIGRHGSSTITELAVLTPRAPKEVQMRSQSTSPPLPPPQPLDAILDPNEPAPSARYLDDETDEEILEELEKTWMLNLSMQFRDQSLREKFFLTYAETPQQWRRVTVSCDYRDAPEESLERDLQNLQSQRDKHARIYESIRQSLADIQFYDTVTNLKLETRDDKLHVHVTEDTNEKIPYPSVHAVEHLKCFVYRVTVEDHTWIKKEIPGPDSVDEFLYELNALSEQKDAQNVINFKGLVVDDDHSVIKGLLIGFAEQGALDDILYDNKGNLPWQGREEWARQIVQGLSETHEAGFVQGDFSLPNAIFNQRHDIDLRALRLPDRLEALLGHDPETDKASTSVNANIPPEKFDASESQRPCRRGRSRRRNDAYWRAYNKSHDTDPFDDRECLFEDKDGKLAMPALANLDTGLKVPGGLIMSSRYAKEIGMYLDISEDFVDPYMRSISGHHTPVTGVLRNVRFRLKGTSITFIRDFYVCDAIDGLVDIMIGASFIKNQLKLLFEKVKGCLGTFATWFSTKKETKKEKQEREQREREQKIKANEREIARLQREQDLLEAQQRRSQQGGSL